MATEETRGTVKRLTGQTKEIAGELLGNKKLEREGAAQRAEGELQETMGEARRKVGEVLADVAQAVKG